MCRSRLMLLVEAPANVVVGMLVAVATQIKGWRKLVVGQFELGKPQRGV